MNEAKMRAAEEQMEAAQQIMAKLPSASTEKQREAIEDEFLSAFHAASDAVREAAATKEDG